VIDEIKVLLDEYTSWLRDKTSLRKINNQWVEITTPFLDRHNDYLQIYAKSEDGEYVLTDDGYTIQDLEQSGCLLESQKRKSLLKLTLNGFGVKLDGDTLSINASDSNFAIRKHNLVQAMLSVNDLFYLAEPYVTGLFLENVVSWLDQNEIRYSPRVKFSGKTGYDYLFDFVIPKSRIQPERIIKTINRPSKETAQFMAFQWLDTRDVRPPDSKAYAFLNDTERSVPAGVSDALRSYNVIPVYWSLRDSVKEELLN